MAGGRQRRRFQICMGISFAGEVESDSSARSGLCVRRSSCYIVYAVLMLITYWHSRNYYITPGGWRKPRKGARNIFLGGSSFIFGQIEIFVAASSPETWKYNLEIGKCISAKLNVLHSYSDFSAILQRYNGKIWLGPLTIHASLESIDGGCTARRPAPSSSQTGTWFTQTWEGAFSYPDLCVCAIEITWFCSRPAVAIAAQLRKKQMSCNGSAWYNSTSGNNRGYRL